jgi:hypothetical protein
LETNEDDKKQESKTNENDKLSKVEEQSDINDNIT